MKIAFVTFLGFPSNVAASINVARACSAMADLGHEVRLICPKKHHERLQGKDVFHHYGLKPSFEVQEIPNWNGPGGRTFFTILTRMALRRYSPDLVIGRYLRAVLAATKMGLNTVYELHSTIKKKREGLELLLRHKNFRLFVAVSGALRHYYLNLGLKGLTEDRIIALPTCRGPVNGRVEPVPLPKATKGLNIGYIGKLQVQKGMNVIKRTSSLLPGHDFHIVGGTPEAIKMWSREIPGENVHFHGYVPPHLVERYIEAMDVCLLPNEPPPQNPENTIYSSPMKALDYMAHGRMILASDLPELRELLTDDTAIFLDPYDAESWAKAISSLSKREILEYGERARARFMENFTMTARCRRLIECALERKTHDGDGA